MTYNYVTLVLDAYDGQGSIVTKGSASFVQSAQLTDPGVEWIPEAPIPGVFRAGSVPSVKLLATDNSAPVPNGWAWTVTFSGVPGDPAGFTFFLPYTGGATQYLSALVPVQAGGTLTGALIPAVVTLVFATTVSVNAARGNDFRLTLTSSAATIANPANPEDGQDITFAIAQDATGSRTVAWDTAYDFGTAGAPALSTAASAVDLAGFKYHAGLAKWICLGSALGF